MQGLDYFIGCPGEHRVIYLDDSNVRHIDVWCPITDPLGGFVWLFYYAPLLTAIFIGATNPLRYRRRVTESLSSKTAPVRQWLHRKLQAKNLRITSLVVLGGTVLYGTLDGHLSAPTKLMAADYWWFWTWWLYLIALLSGASYLLAISPRRYWFNVCLLAVLSSGLVYYDSLAMEGFGYQVGCPEKVFNEQISDEAGNVLGFRRVFQWCPQSHPLEVLTRLANYYRLLVCALIAAANPILLLSQWQQMRQKKNG